SARATRTATGSPRRKLSTLFRSSRKRELAAHSSEGSSNARKTRKLMPAYRPLQALGTQPRHELDVDAQVVEVVAAARAVAEELADLVEVIGGHAAEEAAPARVVHPHEAVVRDVAVAVDDALGDVEERLHRIERAAVAADEGRRVRDRAIGAAVVAVRAAGDGVVEDAGLVRIASVERVGAGRRELPQGSEHARLLAGRVPERRADQAHEPIGERLESGVL